MIKKYLVLPTETSVFISFLVHHQIQDHTIIWTDATDIFDPFLYVPRKTVNEQPRACSSPNVDLMDVEEGA